MTRLEQHFDAMTFSHPVSYQIGDEVFLKVDSEAHGMVVAIMFVPHGVKYLISWGKDADSEHYDMELSKEKPVTTGESYQSFLPPYRLE